MQLLAFRKRLSDTVWQKGAKKVKKGTIDRKSRRKKQENQKKIERKGGRED
jgi:hypothetical protein